jgi:hypothetical protein
VGPERASGEVGRRLGGRRFGGRRFVFVVIGRCEENGSWCVRRCGGDTGVNDWRVIPRR